MNNKKRNLMMSLIFFQSTSLLSAQQKDLSIGDTLPNIQMKEILNSKRVPINTNDFKGKLLILDFWGTWCAPCVANIPRMDSLEKRFGDKIAFLPITDEPLEKVKRFSENYSVVNGKEITTVYNDKTFRKFFNIGALPYYVWINEKGRIVAKTTDEELRNDVIEKVLRQNTKDIVNRKDTKYYAINLKKPIFNVSVFEKNSVKIIPLDTDETIQSVISSYIPGLGSTTHVDSLHFAAINTSIANLYSRMYGMLYYENLNLGILSKGRIIFEFKDNKILDIIKSDSRGQEYLDFLSKNGKCFESIWPKYLSRDHKTILNWIKSDLDKNFGVPLGFKAGVEKKTYRKNALYWRKRKAKRISLLAGSIPWKVTIDLVIRPPIFHFLGSMKDCLDTTFSYPTCRL